MLVCVSVRACLCARVCSVQQYHTCRIPCTHSLVYLYLNVLANTKLFARGHIKISCEYMLKCTYITHVYVHVYPCNIHVSLRVYNLYICVPGHDLHVILQSLHFFLQIYCYRITSVLRPSILFQSSCKPFLQNNATHEDAFFSLECKISQTN